MRILLFTPCQFQGDFVQIIWRLFDFISFLWSLVPDGVLTQFYREEKWRFRREVLSPGLSREGAELGPGWEGLL